MVSRKAPAPVPREALLQPTMMLTGRSASAVYAQPAGELKRLADSGAIVRLARGYYAAVPPGQAAETWRPSLEAVAAGLASAVYGPGVGAIWGLSAARVHGALPRALAIGYACGPHQHRPIALQGRTGEVVFRTRDTMRLDLEYWATELGPARVTSIAQTILDLCSTDLEEADDSRTEAVRDLMAMVDRSELEELAMRSRGRAALRRAQQVGSRGH